MSEKIFILKWLKLWVILQVLKRCCLMLRLDYDSDERYSQRFQANGNNYICYNVLLCSLFRRKIKNIGY